jgi:hypothetical protein
MIAGDRARYAGHLDGIRAMLGAIDVPLAAPEDPTSERPHWHNIWMSGIDAASLCYFLASRRPARYIEIGSGMSTRWARYAIRSHNLPTTITSIDPQPRKEIARLCDRQFREPLEKAPLDPFDDLHAGDIVLMDGSHRTFTNSDATVFVLDVLPDLPAGVLVAVHDVLLPADYPVEWTQRYYSEQYLLAAYLLGGGERLQIELPCYFVVTDAELGSSWAAAWAGAGLDAAPAQGQAFWLTTG